MASQGDLIATTRAASVLPSPALEPLFRELQVSWPGMHGKTLISTGLADLGQRARWRLALGQCLATTTGICTL